MAYDSAATRARLLDAAYGEFVERGLAGARVDRIAAAAQANKQAIYAYFGSKEGLFDAVLAARLSVLADEAPFDPDDLPGYAGSLFDALAATPGLIRLTQWSRLERADATPGEIESHQEKARAVREALKLPDDLAATDILEIVIAIATTWSNMPPGLKAARGVSASARQQVHRATVVAAAKAVCQAL
ncbi:TetR family transcriptional regulator [Actinoplanes sp. Pm04-4]|uniref:TetR family transcriptional regulator n=1 Tax=Paractinoplanes pyxinae TaxID=2997416 RepID=A0ABT4B9L1_9ACTN|nr:TetR family transcriptional regulator [Actinoplanes pyxinae]MCY1143171.1 TetR family transcriptional regulator [Actinoplanes pyxinae]